MEVKTGGVLECSMKKESDGQSEASWRAEKTSNSQCCGRKVWDENYNGIRLEAFRLFSGKELVCILSVP